MMTKVNSAFETELSKEDIKEILGSHSTGQTTIKHGIIRDQHAQSTYPFVRCLSEALHQLGIEFESALIEGKNLEETLKLNAIRFRSIQLESFSDKVEFGLLIAVFDNNCYSIVENRASSRQIIEFKGNSNSIELNNTDSFNYLKESVKIYEIYPPLPFSLETLGDFLAFIFKSFSRDLYAVIIFSALANILQLTFPYLTTYVTTTVLNLGSVAFVLQIAFLAIILTSLSVACLYLQSRYILKLESESDKRAQVSVWDRLLKADLDLLQRYTSVDLAQRAFAVSKIKELMSSSNIIAFVNIVFSFFYLYTMYRYDSVALISILPVVIIFLFIVYFQSVSGGELLSDSLACSARVTSEGREILHSLPELRARGLEDIFLKKWSEYVVQLSTFGCKSRVKDNYIEVASEAFQPMCFLASFTVIFYRLDEYSDTQSLVQLLGYVAALTLFTSNLSAGVSSLADQIVSILAYWSRSKPVIFTAIEAGYGPYTNMIPISGNIKIHNLSFNIKNKPIFSDKNFTFKAGSINLIQSEPNSGVSSFFNLLIGLYPPSQGYISFDNTHLPDIQIAYLRSQITLAPQVPFVPMGPLGELLDSEFTKTDQNLAELMDLLSLNPLVNSLRMGLNTPIPQGATCFGTRQREVLSLARCLKTHTPILILDKCMSSFPIEQKIKVLSYLKKYNITTLISDDCLEEKDFQFDQVINF